MLSCPHCGQEAITAFQKHSISNKRGKTCPHCGKRFRLSRLGWIPFILATGAWQLIRKLFDSPTDWILIGVLTIILILSIMYFIPLAPMPEAEPAESQEQS